MSGKKPLKITILMSSGRWFENHRNRLAESLKERGHEVRLAARHEDIPEGDIALFLSYGRIVPRSVLARNRHNLVAHASPLPRGRGSTPLSWQILEGKNEIPVTLIEAADAVDSGAIYDQEIVRFEGHELLGEMHEALGGAIITLILRFVDAFPGVQGRPQSGEETFYRRRTPADSEVPVDRTLAELFDRFRIADNERFPVFFRHRGHVYRLRIEKADAAETGRVGTERDQGCEPC